MNDKISRRRLLVGMAAGIGGLALASWQRFSNITAASIQESMTPSYLPMVNKVATPTPTPTATPRPVGSSTVVHVYGQNATSWNFDGSWYGSHVSQDVVNSMADAGLKELTGKSTVEAAWQHLLPGYASGKAIAIKVNLNNAGGCDDSDTIIDALPQPVLALVRGMTLAGVQQQDIWVFDASRAMPSRFRSPFGSSFPNVRLMDQRQYTPYCAPNGATFNSTDTSARITFQHPSLQLRHVADPVVNATYFINMPIVKDHGIAGVTLGFKNHFGTIDAIMRQEPDNLHNYISPGNPLYSSSYNPLVDIFKNTHIRNKTVLTVGDGLFGALSNTNVTPTRWTTFGNNALRSLFFSVDPVAIDCVMMDTLYAEPVYHPQKDTNKTDDYLKLAQAAGLGIWERRGTGGYSHIDYRRIDL